MAECECQLKGGREQGKEDSHADPKWSQSLITLHLSPVFKHLSLCSSLPIVGQS